ncbi:hypothetical protein ACFJGV_12910 [Cnuibacter sp. UC19_7]|uniref:hypothetical protein n=1 Tax=Cnuibacter sp. UC19_7 TaxID=3350166 RepID=UPI00366CDA63
MRTLTLLIVVAVAVGGALSASAMIALGDLAERIGPRFLILGIGLLLALPTYLVLLALVRRRTVDIRLSAGPDMLGLRIGDVTHDVALGDIRMLRWRTDSDYARIELSARELDFVLNVGLARQPGGAARQLPPLPARLLDAAERFGLRVSRSRRGVVTLTRA